MKNLASVCRSVVAAVLVGLGIASGAVEAADWTLSSKNSTVNFEDASTYGVYGWTIDGKQIVSQLGFYCRVGTSGPEYPLISNDVDAEGMFTVARPANQADPAALALVYTALDGTYSVEVAYRLTGGATGTKRSTLKRAVTINNHRGSPLDFHFYAYSDYDLSLPFSNDNVAIVGKRAFQSGFTSSSDKNGNGYSVVQSSTLPPSRYGVDMTQFIGLLANGSTPYNLDNFGGPYTNTNADVQFALQWDLAIPANGSVSFEIADEAYPSKPLFLAKTHPGQCAAYAQPLTYTYTYDNTANTIDLHNLLISDKLPAGIDFVSATNGGEYKADTREIVWSLPLLAKGAGQQTFQATVLYNSPRDIAANTANNLTMGLSDETYPRHVQDTIALCNHPPQISSVPATAASASALYTYQVRASDADAGTVLTYSFDAAPSGMSISSAGLVQWTPTNSQTGTFPVTVRVSDGQLAATQSFSIAVAPANRPPVIASSPVTAAVVGQLYSYTVSATDPDGDTLYYSISAPTGKTLPTGMAMGMTTGTLTWTPSSSTPANWDVIVAVTDTKFNRTTQSFTITVTDGKVNQAPVIASSPVTSATEGALYSYQVVASDPNGDSLTYALTTAPSGMSIAANGTISWTPLASQAGAHTVVVTVSDGALSATQTFTVTVTKLNRAPSITSTAVTSVSEGAAYGYAVSASDPDGDALTYSLTASPPGMTISPAGLISWNPGYTDAGSYTVTVKVSDPAGLFATQTYTLLVTDTNRAPVVTMPADQSTPEGTAVNLQIQASDADNNTLAYSATGLPPGLSINSSSGVITGTLGYTAAGIYSVRVMVGDGITSSSVSFSWTVTDVNRAPGVIAPANRTNVEGTVVNLTVAATDPDGDALTYSATGLPAGLAINASTGAITGTIDYSAAAGSPYTVTVTATDPSNAKGSASFTWTVTAYVKQTPSISWATPGAITYGTALGGTQLNATASVPGTFVYTPAAGTVLNAGTRTLSVVFTPSDPNAYTSASATVSLTVDKAVASVSLTGLSATYDGTPKVVAASTTPPGLGINLTYAGGSGAPTAAGSYPVVATVTDANYSGSATGTLAIARAVPAINWAEPAAVYAGTTLGSSQLNATADVAGSFSYNPAAGTVLSTAGPVTLTATFTPADAVNYTTATKSVSIIVNTKQTPSISWATPGAITYGTALGGTQLNATTSVPGTFVYTPAAGTVLNAGTRTLSVVFTPSDPNAYTSASATVSLTVDKAVASVSLTGLSATYDGTPKVVAASTTPPGLGINLTYAGGSGAPTAAGSYPVVATVTDANYSGSATGTLAIARAVPAINWAEPAAVYAGTTLGSSQLNATADVAGSFSYNPAAGTVLSTAGPVTLTATFTPADAVNYTTATKSVSIIVNTKQTPSISWATPGAITYGTALGGTQLNATTSVPGTFVYTPAAGTVLNAGTRTLSVVFTPSDPNAYTSASATVSLTVDKAVASVSLTGLSATYDGTPKVVAASTTPPGLGINLTYAGGSGAPTAAGSYPVVATVTDANYSGSATGTLAIARAVPAINWAEPAAVYAGTTLGSSQLNATADVAGSFSYNPAAGTVLSTAGPVTLTATFTPADAVNYTTATKSVSIIVTMAPQQPPAVIKPADQTSDKDVMVNLQIQAIDADGDALTYSATGLPTGLSINSATGLISGIPTTAGTYTITVSVTDGTATTRTTFTWMVIIPPTAPVVTKPADQASPENGSVSLQIQATDVNGDSLTYSAAGLPPGLTMNSKTGLISGNIPYCSSGTYPVTIMAKDPGNLSGSTMFSWVVTKTNVAPIVTKPANQSSTLNNGVSLQIQATDLNCGDNLIYSASELPSGLAINSGSGLISGTATVAGTYNVVVTVGDGMTTSSTTFSWTVNGQVANDPPVIISSPILIAEKEKAYRYDVNAVDPNNDALTYRLVQRPSRMTINSSTGLISWTPEDSGSYAVTVEVADAKGLKATQSYTLRVVNSNSAPTVTNPGNQTSWEEKPVTLRIKASDSNGDRIFYSATGLPPGIGIDESTGLISGTIAAGAAVGSPYSVSVTVTDTLKSNRTSFNWTVRAAGSNTPPAVSNPGAQTGAENTAVRLQISAADADGDLLSFSATGLPAGLGINAGTGLISGTIAVGAAATGPYTVTVTASDGIASTSAVFAWTVAPAVVNQPPVITSVPAAAAVRGKTYRYDVNATDPNGDTVTYKLVTRPSGMSISSSTGLIQWTPKDTGTYPVKVEVSDAKGLRAYQSFTVTVYRRISDVPAGAVTGFSAQSLTDVFDANGGGAVNPGNARRMLKEGGADSLIPDSNGNGRIDGHDIRTYLGEMR
ncbi:putative Ig domain-containing protein [Geobacter anodireducens]|nr:putative Ig domain-containing protein [Geobacter soli]